MLILWIYLIDDVTSRFWANYRLKTISYGFSNAGAGLTVDLGGSTESPEGLNIRVFPSEQSVDK